MNFFGPMKINKLKVIKLKLGQKIKTTTLLIIIHKTYKKNNNKKKHDKLQLF